ncbi:hypothetical protein QJS10_CPB12g01697 [Acorus calamus]|uniref:Uncharacterized protein n=1 Tax=Acorus calamus TaxID=4465 RepID=A0AAV9DLZ1_ACOCL|nr:hypothetical protein QJS10_CPB12g01697 [Acorus calamus]
MAQMMSRIQILIVADDDFVRSMPPRRRTKSNIRILKDNKIICSSVDTFGHQKDNQNISEKISEPVLKDTKKNGVTNGRGIHVPDSCLQEVAERISVEPTADTTSQSVDLPQYEGNVSKENCASEMPHEMQPVTERLLHVDQAHDAETEGHGTSVVTGQENTPHAASHFIASNIKIGGSFSDTFIHPFIKKKALKLESLVSHRGDRILGSDGQREKGNHYFRTTCDDQPLHATSSDSEQISDNLKLEQLVRAKNLGILEHTPEDEVEGELAYFQNRLLDNALASNYLLEKLVLKVVESLPQELDSLSKQRWDTVFVNQFFREVREAKKQGQREKRHKEAQAVLAAAAEAAATSSRNSSFRRDGHDDGAHVHTESPQKAV